jgi:hypothetical protein
MYIRVRLDVLLDRRKVAVLICEMVRKPDPDGQPLGQLIESLVYLFLGGGERSEGGGFPPEESVEDIRASALGIGDDGDGDADIPF